MYVALQIMYLEVISVASSSRRLCVPVRLNSCHNSVKDWSLVVMMTLTVPVTDQSWVLEFFGQLNAIIILKTLVYFLLTWLNDFIILLSNSILCLQFTSCIQIHLLLRFVFLYHLKLPPLDICFCHNILILPVTLSVDTTTSYHHCTALTWPPHCLAPTEQLCVV